MVAKPTEKVFFFCFKRINSAVIPVYYSVPLFILLVLLSIGSMLKSWLSGVTAGLPKASR
jgi:hypothetical protein